MSVVNYVDPDGRPHYSGFRMEVSGDREWARCDFTRTYNKNLESVDEQGEANVVTSLVRRRSTEFGAPDAVVHRPVLDIDIPAHLVPSSTEGHSHLYLDVEMSWGEYLHLLEALARAKIIEDGFLIGSLRNKASCVRLPWVKKPKGAVTISDDPDCDLDWDDLF